MLHDEREYPDPMAFKPERFIANEGSGADYKAPRGPERSRSDSAGGAYYLFLAFLG